MRKFYLLLLSCVCFFYGSFAQTIIINPATNGGFESGNTFALNNWTVVNSVLSPNLWQVGNATFNSGSNSAYISSDGGITNSYNNNIAGVSHFYTDVTIPAGVANITLSFYLKGDTQAGSDFLRVYADQTSPVPATPLPDVSLGAGSTLIYTQSASNAGYVVQSINLTSTLSPGPVRLIFSWENDGDGNGANPATVDDISLITCTNPAAYAVNGGGGYCPAGTGVDIGLSNSDPGVSYQLQNSLPANVGTAVAGTGGAIDFGLQTAADTYTVVATSGACTSTMTGSATVTIFPLPTVSAGNPFTITCIANASGAPIGENNDPTASYSWDMPTGLTPSAFVSNPTADPTNTTTYTVTKTNTTTGCSNTASVTVTVDNTPPTVSAGSPFTKTCVLNPTGAAIGELNDINATYSWSPTTGLTPSATASNPNANPGGTTNYTVTKTLNSNGCTATASVLVTVDITPPTVSAGNPFTKTCVLNPTGAAIGELNDINATYSWSPNTNLTPSSTVSNPTANPTNTTTYTVTKTSNINGCTNTDAVVVTVNTTPPTVSAGGPFTKTCTSNPTGATIGETNDVTSTYSWSPSGGLTPTATVSNPNADPATNTNYTVTKTSNANGCTSSASVLVSVDNTVPTVSAGNPFTTTCTAFLTGAAIGEAAAPGATYSWSPNTNLTPSSTVSNPTANPTTTTTYTVTKTITATGCTNSASVTVTVDNAPPTVSAGPAVTKTCTLNSSGAVIGEANDLTATYSWSPNTALSPSSTVSNPVANPATTTPYTVTKTNIANGCTNTASVTVTVNTTPPTVSAGSPFTKTCATNPTGAAIGEPNDLTATYSWSPAGGLTPTATVSNPNADPATNTNYTVTKTSNANGCTSSASVLVSVDNSIPVVSITGSTLICLPGTTTLSPTSGGTWMSSDNSVATVTNAGLVTGASGGTATFTFTQTSTGCTNTTPAVTVTPTPTVNVIGNQSLCKGAMTAAVHFTGAATTYAWSNNNTSIGLAATGTGDIASFTAVNVGSTILVATITVTPSTGSCTGATKSFTITVDPTPTAVVTNGNQILCNNTNTLPISFSGAVLGTTYNWTNDNTSIGLAGSGSGDILSFTATNSGNANVVANIKVTPDASGCGGTSISFTITVKPTPTVNAIASQTWCNGSNTTAINFSGNIASGVTYTWSNSAGPGDGFAASGTGNIPAFPATNLSGSIVVSNFIVTPSINSCTGTSQGFSITINPTPTVAPAPSDQTVCNGLATTAVHFTGAVSGATYNWTNSNTTIGLSAATGTGDIPSFITTNTGATAVTATIQVTPSANSCTGSPINFNIKVNPSPTANAGPAMPDICQGGTSVALGGSVGGAATSGSWSSPAGGTFNPSAINLNATWTPPAAYSGTATLTLTTIGGLCGSATASKPINVNPTPTVTNPGNQAVCKGASTTAITFTGSVAGATYNWTNSNTAIGLSAPSGTNSIPSFTGINTTSSPVSTTITVIPTANSCPGPQITFTITINPVAAINNVIDSICTGSSFNELPVDGTDGIVPSGTTYTWSAPVVTGGMTGGSAQSTPQSSISQTLTNNTTTAQTATYTVTPVSGICTGPSFTLTVYVFPYPPKQYIDFFQSNVISQQLCVGAQVGGGGQNDLDVHLEGFPPNPNGGQPANNFYDTQGYGWTWEYANGNATGPTNPFGLSTGTTSTHYQHVLPPAPSAFTPIGDYWFRFSLTQNGCTTYTDTIHLQVTSTLIAKAGGPYVRCLGAGSFALAGSSITGTSSSQITGQWSISPSTPGGSLSNVAAINAGTPAGNAALSAVTYTPPTTPGTYKLLLQSNPPGAGCGPAIDSAYVIVLPVGNLAGCTAPYKWTLNKNGGNGNIDSTQSPCAATLIGSNSGSGSSTNTDFTICSGTGNFSFNWVFTAPTTGGAIPVWHTADQTTNFGAGTTRGSMVANKPANLAVGDLIIVILHARDNMGSIAAPDGFSSIRNDVGGNSGNTNRGAVYSYWKIATAADLALPALNTYAFQANSMATNDDWAAVAGRVTGADPNNPIDASNGINSNTSNVTTLTAPAVTTLGLNRLLIGSVSIADNNHGTVAAPAGMTTLIAGNNALGKHITYGDYFVNIPAAGSSGTEQFSWTTSDPAAAQLFAILPAAIPDDSAFALVNGVKTLLSGTSGTQGTFSVPVNTNDQVGLRVSTLTNSGGAGNLVFYNVVIPNDTPRLSGTAAITIPVCSPASPTSYFVAPTVLPDNCGTPTLFSMTDGPVSNSGCTNTQTRTWIYADACGLQSKPFVQTLTWTNDNTPPSITCVPPQAPCFDASNNYNIPTLSASDLCSGGINYSYTITGATNRNGITNDASGTFNLGISTINWTVKDGCGNTATCFTIVTIGATPTATMSGGTSICAGGSATISVLLTGNAPWSITYYNGSANVTVPNIMTSPYTFTVNPATTTTYSMVDMTSANCGLGLGTVSGSATIIVRPLPTATISGTTAICSGFSTNLSIAPTGSSPWTITYTDGTSVFTVSGGTSPLTPPVSPTTTTTYTLSSVTDKNCTATITGQSVVITVNQKPTVAVTPSAPSICTGGNVGLTASGASTYSWSPNTNISSTTGTTVVANPTSTIMYTVTGTDANMCVNTATVTVTVSTPPATTGVTICQGGTGNLSAASCSGGNFTVGPYNPTTAANVTGAGTVAWSSPGNITAPGAPYATAGFPATAGVIANYLQGTGYGFSIPITANILGITVVINRFTSVGAANDAGVQLLKAGALSGTSMIGGNWPTSMNTVTYGGAANLWGIAWTPADINDPNFGVSLSARSVTAAVKTLTVDYMQITVTYNIPGSATWYTVSSGGSSIGIGSTFNPVGVTGSGLANTNTPGTTIYYAECPIAPGCRTATNYVINPTTVPGSLSTPPSVCSSASGTLTLSGNTGNVLQWESSTNLGGSWTVLAPNTTTSQAYTATAQTTLYRALVQSGVCASVYSTIATVGIHNLWTGATSTDWNTGTNWSDGLVPTPLPCPTVMIPTVTLPNVYPILSSGTATITNLVISLGASATVSGTGILQVAGTITNGGTFDVSNGTVELNGTSLTQNIATGEFTNNKIHGLVISNSTLGGVTLGGPLDVYGPLTYGAAGTQFVTNNNLTLKSTATETASLGSLTGHTITGNVTVERYIATGTGSAPNHGKSWQLLAIPTTGETIKQAWQEGAVIVNGNPNAGFGTQITSNIPTAITQPDPGFDAFTSTGPSLKTYNSATNSFIGPASTQLPIYNQKGYYVFVRGARNITLFNQAANATVLRTKGALFTPANPPPVTTVIAGQFESIGNPYASALAKSQVIEGAGIEEFFYVWDPRLGGSYNYGAYQTFSKSGSNYVATPSGGSYGPAGTPNNFIESGQAFLVHATSTNTVSFAESSKAVDNTLFARPANILQVQGALRISLNAVNTDGSADLLDGVLINFDDAYSNAVDGLDARKLSNTGENLSIRVGGQLLAVERRKNITQQDTIFLNLTGVNVELYQFSFDAENLNTVGIEGFLEDSYLHTRTPVNLNGSTLVNFNMVNIAGAYAPDRFRIVFESPVVLPVTFTSIKAYLQDKNINVEWRVENEVNMKQYEVEKSVDGTRFTTLTVLPATANGMPSAIYVATDINPVEGYNYYRVKSVDVNGKTAYTNIVKVMVGSLKRDITINPNPITDGIIHLQFLNQPEGKYGIRLLNKLGQVIISKQISHAEGTSTELIKWDYSLAHGIYQLEVTKPDGGVKDLNVLY